MQSSKDDDVKACSTLKVRTCSPLKGRMCSPLKVRTCSPLNVRVTRFFYDKEAKNQLKNG